MNTIQDRIRASATALKSRTGETGNIIRLGLKSWDQLVAELGGRIPELYEGMEFVDPKLQEPDDVEVVRWDDDYLKKARAFTHAKNV